MTQAQVPPLNQVYFYLVEGCNLACRHCWIAPRYDPQGTRSATLPVQLFESVIRQGQPLGLSGVKLTGGERLLHRQFETLLDIVYRAGLNLTIETNGLLMTPALAKRIAGFPHHFISVSLDGADAETHEWVRGVKGSFTAATRAVRFLADAGASPQVIFSIMRANAHQVEAVIRLAEELGAGSVKFNVIQPTARGKAIHDGEAGLSAAEYIQIGRQVDMELAQTTSLRLDYDYPVAFRPLSRLAAPDGCDTCGILGILGVLASGHFALCGIGEHIPELVFGAVDACTLESVWRENATLQALRAGLPHQLDGICADCLMVGRCLGACIAQNVYRSGKLFEPYWFCEEAQSLGLFPWTRNKSFIF